jgi:hypothetical protein
MYQNCLYLWALSTFTSGYRTIFGMEEKKIDVKLLDGASQIGHRGTKTPSSRSRQNTKKLFWGSLFCLNLRLTEL